MEISFIGCGKAANSLGKYFLKKGHRIKYICDVLQEKQESFVKEIGGEIGSLEEIVSNSQIVFLTVADSYIYPLWKKIQRLHIKKDTIFIHCSGAKKGVYENDVHLHALHPASAMTGDSELDNINFGLERKGNKLEDIKEFLKTLGNKVYIINPDKKVEYHLASVFSSNLMLSLFQIGTKYMEQAGLSEEEAIKFLMPLVKQNLDNIEKNGINKSITGPASRKDLETIGNHLRVIDKLDKETYITLSKNIAKILQIDLSL